MLNYMLNTRYGSSDYTAMHRLFTDDSKEDIQVFANFINGFNNNGKLNVEKGPNGWTINARPISSVFNGRARSDKLFYATAFKDEIYVLRFNTSSIVTI